MQIRHFEHLFDTALQADNPRLLAEGAMVVLQRFGMASRGFLVRVDQETRTENVLHDDFAGRLHGLWLTREDGQATPVLDYIELGSLASLAAEHTAALSLQGLGLENGLIVSHKPSPRTRYVMVLVPAQACPYHHLAMLSLQTLTQRLFDACECAHYAGAMQGLLAPCESDLAVLAAQPGVKLKTAALALGMSEAKGSNVMSSIRRKLLRAGHAVFSTRDAAELVARHTPERERRRVINALSRAA